MSRRLYVHLLNKTCKRHRYHGTPTKSLLSFPTVSFNKDKKRAREGMCVTEQILPQFDGGRRGNVMAKRRGVSSFVMSAETS